MWQRAATYSAKLDLSGISSCQAHTISINSTGGACTVTDRATASTIPNLSQVWRTRSSQPLHKPKCPNRKKREEENSPARKES